MGGLRRLIAADAVALVFDGLDESAKPAERLAAIDTSAVGPVTTWS